MWHGDVASHQVESLYLLASALCGIIVVFIALNLVMFFSNAFSLHYIT